MTEIERLAQLLTRIELQQSYEGELIENVPFEAIDRAVKQGWESRVYAVKSLLQALREPSKAMVDAGDDAQDSARGTFTAMIDHLLQESEEQ